MPLARSPSGKLREDNEAPRGSRETGGDIEGVETDGSEDGQDRRGLNLSQLAVSSFAPTHLSCADTPLLTPEPLKYEPQIRLVIKNGEIFPTEDQEDSLLWMSDDAHGSSTSAPTFRSAPWRTAIGRSFFELSSAEHWTLELGFEDNDDLVDLLYDTFAAFNEEIVGKSSQLRERPDWDGEEDLAWVVDEEGRTEGVAGVIFEHADAGVLGEDNNDIALTSETPRSSRKRKRPIQLVVELGSSP